MKNSLIAAAMALGLGAVGNAQALSITVTTMEWYDAAGVHVTEDYPGWSETETVN